MLNTIIMGKICIQVGNCNKFFVYAYLLIKVGGVYHIIHIKTFLIMVCSLFLYVIKDDKIEK